MANPLRLSKPILEEALDKIGPGPNLISGAFKFADNAITRTIHVKIHPRPRSLRETGQILHELRKYGEIEIFKHMKYDTASPAPNTLIAAYKTSSSADRAVAANIHEFSYASPPLPVGSEAEAEVYSHREPYARPCKLVIRPARYLHLPYIERQAYYWPQDSPKDVVRPGLAMLGKVPADVGGLGDFDVTKGEASFKSRVLASRNRQREWEERGWKTLGELWEIGRQKREAEGNGDGENVDKP